LFADPDQPARVGCALRMIAELERAARLTGKPLRRRAVRRAANRTGRGAQRGVSRSARASKRRRSGST